MVSRGLDGATYIGLAHRFNVPLVQLDPVENSGLRAEGVPFEALRGYFDNLVVAKE